MKNNTFVDNGNRLIVSEYVGFGHPDKIADQIADAILDKYLKVDSNVRAGIEVMVKDNIVVLGGEINSSASINYDEAVREVYKNLNFPSEHHLSPSEIKIINLIGKQSAEISSGIEKEDDIGAGDQGFVCGFASNETSTYMPLGHYLAKCICSCISRRELFGPDVKSQVIIEYDKDNKAVGIHSILVSTMHQCSLSCVRETVNLAIRNNYINIDNDIYETFIKDKEIKIDVNPCGAWHIGGPVSDCGVTGRKLVVDSYGGYCNIGGGNFSGKCMSKVDRSGAYMARYLAKNIVASGFCDTAKVTLSYMIGIPEPCSVEIEVNRNEDKVPQLKKWIFENIKLTPKAFIENLTSKCFYLTSKNGHFGYNVNYNPFEESVYPWERVDIAESFKQFV